MKCLYLFLNYHISDVVIYIFIHHNYGSTKGKKITAKKLK